MTSTSTKLPAWRTAETSTRYPAALLLGIDSPPPRRATHTPDPAVPTASQHSKHSTCSTSSLHSTLPVDLVSHIAYALRSLDAMATLASLSLVSKDTHDLVSPILFEGITIRSHRQLTAILCSINTSALDNGKRRTRQSEPRCDSEAKLARFRLTKHLSINHFPSLQNLNRLGALQDRFKESPVFASVDSVYIAPILVHHLHPATCGKSGTAMAKRARDAHLLKTLARPNRLTINMRALKEPIDQSSESTRATRGCTCIDGFCASLEEVWKTDGRFQVLQIHLDAATLSSHYFSTTATGPLLRLVLSHCSTTSDQPSLHLAKKTRHSQLSSDSPIITIPHALSAYILHRVRSVREHRGGKVVILVPVSQVGGEQDLRAMTTDMLRDARGLATDDEQEDFKQVRCQRMLAAIELEAWHGDETASADRYVDD
jgi:hypothetical protein